ncbi:MAG: alpha-amylase family glycosyl hydrolase [Actinomycetes bacterium]
MPDQFDGHETNRSATPWWRDAVFYQIYPRSFADSNGDGVGDLDGIRAHLGDLAWLGVDALWISPFYRSPMADFGYDVSDYCDVDPTFGDLDAFDALLAEAHSLGLRVIIDWVPNHTSDEHPWFLDAASSPTSEHRNWYVWREPDEDGTPPNNWVAAFDLTAPAWSVHPETGQWYLHLFDPAQPDLNWDEPSVVEAMHDVLRFWLDRGVDGFRADVLHTIGKFPDLPDDPPAVAGIPHCALNDVPVTHERVRAIRSLIDSYANERVLVGEIYLMSTEAIADYYGTGDEVHMAFNFPALYAPWSADRWRSSIKETEATLDPRGAWPAWVLSNHDNPRHRTRYDIAMQRRGEDAVTTARRSEARARAAAVLLLTLRGTPFLYQGEELGLLDSEVAPEQVMDPGGRDGCRGPLPWGAIDGHGWPTGTDGATPWLPLPPEVGMRNRVAQQADPNSILHLYRRLLELRKSTAALRGGDLELLDAPEGVLAFSRRAGAEVCHVLINMHDEQVTLDEQLVPAGAAVLLASDAVDPTGVQEQLGPDQALIIRL